MNWIYKLERKIGKYTIKNLMNYIIGAYAIGFVLNIFAPGVYEVFLSLDAEKILHGQIWRIVTFIMQPPSSSIFFLFFVMYFYYMIGTVLERIWGTFRFNIYFFSGMLFNVLAAIIIYLIFGVNFHLSTYYINLALFMAFAFEHPDSQVLLFFIIPIKIKWLAYLDMAIFGVTIFGGFAVTFLPKNIWYGLYQLGLLAGNAYTCYVLATAAFVSMMNFILFMTIFKKSTRYTSQTQKNFRKATQTQKKTYEKINPAGTKHKCAVCGRTEKDGDDLVFRYCSKCEGNYEYCQDHLYTHVHVKK